MSGGRHGRYRSHFPAGHWSEGEKVLATGMLTVVKLPQMVAVKSQEDVKGSRTERDRLKGYREKLELVRRSSEAVAALRERVSGLEKRLSELELESLKFQDSDGTLEQESGLLMAARVTESKLSRVRQKLSQAEGGLDAQMGAVRGGVLAATPDLQAPSGRG